MEIDANTVIQKYQQALADMTNRAICAEAMLEKSQAENALLRSAAHAPATAEAAVAAGCAVRRPNNASTNSKPHLTPKGRKTNANNK